MKNTPWNLLFAIKEAYSKCMKPVCEKYGLNHMELSVLLFIWENPDNDTAADIVKMRYLSKSHVSSSINHLEKNGYIKREKVKDNNKTMHLKLQEKAKEVIREGRNAQMEFENILTKDISDEFLSAFKEIVEKMDFNLREFIREA